MDPLTDPTTGELLDPIKLYNQPFFDTEAALAYPSALHVVPVVLADTGAKSIIDLGCGTGAWINVAAWHGITDVYGVDLYAPEAGFVHNHDLTAGYDCTGYDLAICLETAEHLPCSADEPLVAGLCTVPHVLFSAATPDQTGVGHINRHPHEYWHDHFDNHGYTPTWYGGQFAPPVADFYRRNMYLYRPV